MSCTNTIEKIAQYGFNYEIKDTWGFYDVQDRIRDRLDDQDYTMDLSTGIEILDYMKKFYDSGIGYNWDVVDDAYTAITGKTFNVEN